MSPVFVQHIIPQRKEFTGVQVVGFRLAAVPDDGIDPAPGRGQQGDHPVIIPVIDVPQHDGSVFCLNHIILCSGRPVGVSVKLCYHKGQLIAIDPAAGADRVQSIIQGFPVKGGQARG